MRHTRNRQMTKVDVSKWKGEKNAPISLMRNTYLAHKLDKSFMWIRYDSDYYKGRTRNYYSFAGQMYARKIK